MGEQLYPILLIYAIACLVLSIVGLFFHVIAVKRTRREFRSKGFLQVPSGLAWIGFFRRRHYRFFKDKFARFCYGVAYFCLLGMVFISVAALLLIGSTLILRQVS